MSGQLVQMNAVTVAGTTPGTGGLAVLDDASTDAVLTTLGFPAALTISGGQRKIRPPSSTGTGVFLTIAAVAYFVYLGKTMRAVTPKYVAAHLHTVATTDSVGELGFFTTPLPPNKAGQTLTPVASAFKTAWDDLTAGGGAAPRRVGNAVALAVSIPAGVELWAGIRTNTGGNEPTFLGIHVDALGGEVLTTAAAAAFDGSTTYAGLVPAVAAVNTAVAPYLWAELD